MIKINGERITYGHFPDGTFLKLDFDKKFLQVENDVYPPYVEITWLYESDEEMTALYYIVNHIRSNHTYGKEARINLLMPYIPNARMDRVKSTSEIFTLKHFCDFINSLGFNKVCVFDPHSNVSAALINNIFIIQPDTIIASVIDDIGYVDCGGFMSATPMAIYFPDEGAYKRYKDVPVLDGMKHFYGKKNRDWKTGKILGLDVYNKDGDKVKEEDIKGLTILMIDDIISFGGTLAYSADKLKELGADFVYAYASHTENSVLDRQQGTLLKRLNEGTVDELFTTNSIYNGHHERITVIQNF